MGYVAVRGGGAAIEESLKLLEYERVRKTPAAGVDEIAALFPELIDQVMGEASLYAPQLAALALKQAQGCPDEAVFLLRAFRSTLERPYVSEPLDTSLMQTNRRISAAFKDVPGGQILGSTRDYSHRLLAFDLAEETEDALAEKLEELREHFVSLASDPDEGASAERELEGKLIDGIQAEGDHGRAALPRVLDHLRDLGLVKDPQATDVSSEGADPDPVDATMVPLSFPVPRSMRLQILARGMTQAVESLGYAAIRGFGPAHPTVGELRRGFVPVLVAPTPADSSKKASADAECHDAGGRLSESDAYYIGKIPLTEVESVFMSEDESSGTASAMELAVGYGLVMGGAETKAIAMSVLDRCLELGDKRFPTEDEEFVLYHIDGVEAMGFISHLKLPHYVTFQSKLSSIRGTREERCDAK